MHFSSHMIHRRTDDWLDTRILLSSPEIAFDMKFSAAGVKIYVFQSGEIVQDTDLVCPNYGVKTQSHVIVVFVRCPVGLEICHEPWGDIEATEADANVFDHSNVFWIDSIEPQTRIRGWSIGQLKSTEFPED